MIGNERPNIRSLEQTLFEAGNERPNIQSLEQTLFETGNGSSEISGKEGCMQTSPERKEKYYAESDV